MIIAFISRALAQGEIPLYKKSHFLSEEEMKRMGEVGKNFYPTDPPVAPARQVAEFERMQSVLIRYPFGIPMELIAEIAEDCNVTTIVANSFQENHVKGMYSDYGIDLDKCDFIRAPSDSYWTRDYGPWFVTNGNNEFGITNFPYNRPRPNDDDIPIEVADYLGVDLYGMNLVHTGGNYMCDGMGVAASTELVYDENESISHDSIHQLVKDYLGIDIYHVLPDPLDAYIEHIDCWGKYLDVDKVLIGEVPESDPRYKDFEYVADYFADTTSSYGNPYQVFRVMTPGDYPYTPYTNSLIINEKVLVPVTGHEYDDEALEVYEEAMPGYEVIGVYSDSWMNTDALHCRTKGIADIGMLYIKHYPLLGEIPYEDGYQLSARIYPYSGEELISSSLKIYYKLNDNDYTWIQMSKQFGYNYAATISGNPVGTKISYYISASDKSGRHETHPFIGSADPHIFHVGEPDGMDITVIPDTLFYTELNQMWEGLDLKIYNFNEDTSVDINYINNEGSDGGFHWYIDPWNIEFPYTLNPDDSLILTVKIDVPVEYAPDFVYDTIFIESEASLRQSVIAVDEDLISTVKDYQIDQIRTYPNPFTDLLNIDIETDDYSALIIEVFSLNGIKVKTLVQNNESNINNITWDGTSDNNHEVDNGIYLIRIEKGNKVMIKKVVKVR